MLTYFPKTPNPSHPSPAWNFGFNDDSDKFLVQAAILISAVLQLTKKNYSCLSISKAA